jgi:hypothetical protein
MQELSLKYGSEKANYENRLKQADTFVYNKKIELEKLYQLLTDRKNEQQINLDQVLIVFSECLNFYS